MLLVDPATTPLTPLLQSLCLPLNDGTQALWQASGWSALTLADALPGPAA